MNMHSVFYSIRTSLSSPISLASISAQYILLEMAHSDSPTSSTSGQPSLVNRPKVASRAVFFGTVSLSLTLNVPCLVVAQPLLRAVNLLPLLSILLNKNFPLPQIYS